MLLYRNTFLILLTGSTVSHPINPIEPTPIILSAKTLQKLGTHALDWAIYEVKGIPEFVKGFFTPSRIVAMGTKGVVTVALAAAKPSTAGSLASNAFVMPVAAPHLPSLRGT